VDDRALNVAVWADAATGVGAGHVMRCLALAEALRVAGARVAFFGLVDIDGVASTITERGFELTRLSLPVESGVSELQAHLDRRSEPMDWLVVDSYGADVREETSLRSLVERIAVIDDLANRPHDCDLLLDQNLAEDSMRRYDSLVPASAVQLLGPRFALLRSEFWELERLRRPRDGTVDRVLVSFGGTDPTQETLKAVEAIEVLAVHLHVDVVLGGAEEPYRARVREVVRRLPDACMHEHVSNMADLMAAADLMLGAGGSTTWERCALGLPSITVVVAENQSKVTENVARRGATVSLGWHGCVDVASMADALSHLLQCPDYVRAISAAASDVVEGRSDGAMVVADVMHALARPQRTCRLRDMVEQDLPLLLRWRNSERVRLAMTDQHVITPAEHAEWFAASLANPNRHHYVLECGTTPLGVVSLKRGEQQGFFEWGLYIGEPWAPGGSGALMGALALERAFTALGAQEVRARVLASNAASLRFHEKMGFARFGSEERNGHLEFDYRMTHPMWNSLDHSAIEQGNQ